MNKQFPWGIVVSLVAIVLISVGGAYLLYRIINEGSPFKPTQAHVAARNAPPEGNVSAAASDPAASGFMVLHLRASVEMSPDSGTAAFDLAIENRGFEKECPGKVVTLDHRTQSQDFWSEEEGAIAQSDSVVCLAANEADARAEVAGAPDATRTALDDDDAAQYPDAVIEAKAHSVFVKVGSSGYMLYAGGAVFKSCAAGCEAGAAVGLSVTKVKRALSEDRFVFAVPAGDSKTVSVAAIVTGK